MSVSIAALSARPWQAGAIQRGAVAAGLVALLAAGAPVAQAQASGPAAARGGGQRLVPAGSEITFVAKQLGVPLEGRFKRFNAQVAFDPRQPGTSRIAFQVDLGSVSINPETDAELLKPEWFNTGKFPQATFVSTAIRPLGGGRFEVAGKLAIKGNSRDLVVPVQLAQAAVPGPTTATGGFTLKRLDFKVGDGEWADPSVVANDVQVRFKLVLAGVPRL